MYLLISTAPLLMRCSPVHGNLHLPQIHAQRSLQKGKGLRMLTVITGKQLPTTRFATKRRMVSMCVVSMERWEWIQTLMKRYWMTSNDSFSTFNTFRGDGIAGLKANHLRQVYTKMINSFLMSNT